MKLKFYPEARENIFSTGAYGPPATHGANSLCSWLDNELSDQFKPRNIGSQSGFLRIDRLITSHDIFTRQGYKRIFIFAICLALHNGTRRQGNKYDDLIIPISPSSINHSVLLILSYRLAARRARLRTRPARSPSTLSRIFSFYLFPVTFRKTEVAAVAAAAAAFCFACFCPQRFIAPAFVIFPPVMI